MDYESVELEYSDDGSYDYDEESESEMDSEDEGILKGIIIISLVPRLPFFS